MVKMSGIDVRGVLGILLKTYTVSNTSVKTLYLPVGSAGCTVHRAWTLLHNKGFLWYNYTNEGEGCRVWVANTVNTFEAEGFVVPGTTQHDNKHI